MKRALAGLAGLALAAALDAPAAHASGFLIYDLSGEAMARGSAVSATTMAPDAVWFNPAALAYQGGVQAQAGGVLVTAQSSFTPEGGGPETQSQRGNFLLPTFYANGAINDRLAVGMGVYTAFGIGIDWPNDWIGRESIIRAKVETVSFNPTLAFKINSQWAVAAGFDAFRATVDFITGLPAVVGGDVQLVGGTWGFGGNAGILFRPIPGKLHFAATYRSRANLSFDNGHAHFSPNPEFAGTPALMDQTGNASFKLPDIITLGGMYGVTRKLTLSLDFNVVVWSAFSRIDINFDGGAPSRVLQPNGQTTVTGRLGADYASERWPGMHLRAGFIADRTAIPAGSLGPSLPDSTRVDFALGAGYQFGHFRADLGYLLVYFLPADSTGGREGPIGTYRTIANLVGLTVGATWP